MSNISRLFPKSLPLPQKPMASVKKKILLIGEYSRLHNSLKEGLTALGHEVTLVSTGDDFKQFPSDILLQKKFSRGWKKKLKVGIFQLTGRDITSELVKRQFMSHKDRLSGYDVVQLINESPFSIAAKCEMEIASFLAARNDKLFLLSCGADYSSIRFAFDKKIRYSILNPLFEGKVSVKDFAPALKYLEPDFQKLHLFLYKKINGIIASDMDYHLPLVGDKKYCGLLPNPINTDKLTYIPPEIGGPIKIFHGINRANYYKKGSDYFEAALEIIRRKHRGRVDIITAENVPYKEYIQLYDAAHILLDQVYSFDQGYNALEAMAKGKVVFTGAEKEFLEFYNLQEDEVCINARDQVDDLVSKLEFLILNPDHISRISRNARAFIEREHNYRKIAARYLEVWERV